MINESVTFDGLTGAGKTILGLLMAEAVDAYYLETRVLYHAAAWAVSRAVIRRTDIDLVNYAVEDMQVELVEHTAEMSDLGLIKDAFCDWGEIKVKYYNMLINGELYNREKLLEEQQNWGTRWLAARYDPVFYALLDNLDVRQILEVKAQVLAQNYPLIMGGDKAGPSFLRNAQEKYFLTATHRVRIVRITNTWRRLGIPMSRSDIRPEVLQHDNEYMKRYAQLNMSYLTEEADHFVEKLPRVYPVRDTYWNAVIHQETDTRPFVVNTNVLTAYEAAKLIRPDLPIVLHKNDLHNWIML